MSTRKKAQNLAVPGKKPTDQPAPSYEPNLEEIRERAYQIYLQRGRMGDFDLEDWLQAEKELKESSNKRTRA